MKISAEMFLIKELVDPVNRKAIHSYLLMVSRTIATLDSSLAPTSQSDSLAKRFQSYVDAEEKRLKDGLEAVNYQIDAMETLSLIVGSGRIEKVSPLLRLLRSALLC